MAASKVRSQGNRYSGQLLRQIRHGEGEYMYTNTFFKYKGMWVNGVKHGHGKLYLGDGGYYEGSFIHGEIEGHGYRVFGLTGATYSGQFHNGEMHGQGILCGPDGCQYEGSFVENKKEGEGILTGADGSIYEGSFYDNKKHGEGTQLYSNGDKYEGNWVCNKRQGHGELTCADGSIYKGQWCNDLFHGEGTLSHCSGMRYSGLWIKGRPEVESAYMRCAFKGSSDELCVHQGDRLSIKVECCTHEGLVNTSDNGRILKISAWLKSLSDPAARSSHSQSQRSIHMSQGKLSQFSVVQPVDLFKKEAAFKTPMGYDVYPYQVATQCLEETRCQSADLKSYSKSSYSESHQQCMPIISEPETEDNQITVGVEKFSTFPMKRLQSNSLVANVGKEDMTQAENLQTSSFVLPAVIANADDVMQHGVSVPPVQIACGTATFVDLHLPPPPPSQIISPPGSESSKEDLLEVSEAGPSAQKPDSTQDCKRDTSKLLTALQPKREKYCRPGEYLLMIEDITMPPFPKYQLPPYFMPLTILPKK